jgi:hypothetical protein
MKRGIEARNVDSMKHKTERAFARRVMMALLHPDCPILILDHEASQLARHVSIRLGRFGAGAQSKQDDEVDE